MVDTIRQKLPTVARILFGLLFFVFGLNGFLHFAPNPPMPESAGAFMGALAATGYMIGLIKGTEIVAGLLLLGGRFVPLALTLLAPIIVNIALFHIILAPAGMAMSLALVGVELYLAWAYRDSFKGMLAAAATPAQAPARAEGAAGHRVAA